MVITKGKIGFGTFSFQHCFSSQRLLHFANARKSSVRRTVKGEVELVDATISCNSGGFAYTSVVKECTIKPVLTPELGSNESFYPTSV